MSTTTRMRRPVCGEDTWGLYRGMGALHAASGALALILAPSSAADRGAMISVA